MHNNEGFQSGPGHESRFGEAHEHEQFVGGIIDGVTGRGTPAPLNETQELELAGELLEAGNDRELEQVLGDVFSTVGDTVGRAVRSDAGRALGGILVDAARRALPMVGYGHQGGTLAEAAGSLLGLELEGLSPQDQEFEAARQFVRFASAAAEHAAQAPQSLSPATVAHAAAAAAAHQFAPGIAHEIPRPRYGRHSAAGYGAGRERPRHGGVAPGRGEQRPNAGARGPLAGRRPGGPAGGIRPGRSAFRGRPRVPQFGRALPQRSSVGRGRQLGGRPGQPRPMGWRSLQGRPQAPWQASRSFAPRSPGQAWRPPGPGGQRWRQPGGSPRGDPGQAWRPQGPGGQRWRQPGGGQRRGPGGSEPFAQSSPGGREWPEQGGVPFQGFGDAGGPAAQGQGGDWLRPRSFLGPTPPEAPPGAPGRWFYRGQRHGRRLWVWLPLRAESAFDPSAPPVEWPDPDGGTWGSEPPTAEPGWDTTGGADAPAGGGTADAGAASDRTPMVPAQGAGGQSAGNGSPPTPAPPGPGDQAPTNGAATPNGAGGAGGM